MSRQFQSLVNDKDKQIDLLKQELINAGISLSSVDTILKTTNDSNEQIRNYNDDELLAALKEKNEL